jgi:misacylated tRNA(Ala) deacylase
MKMVRKLFTLVFLMEEIDELEKGVNDIIQGDLPVTEAFVTRNEAERLYNLDRLPEEAGDRIRIVGIGDYDACPCIAPHVKSTGQIGAFRVVSANFEKSVLRIRYKLSKSSGDEGYPFT